MRRSGLTLVTLLLLIASVTCIILSNQRASLVLTSLALLALEFDHHRLNKALRHSQLEARLKQVRDNADWVWYLRHAENAGRPIFDLFTLQKVRDGLLAMEESMRHRLGGKS